MRLRRFVLVVCAVLISLHPFNASSLANGSSFNTRQGIHTYDASGTAAGVCGPGGSGSSKNIPEEWAQIFNSAGAKFGVNPNFLATLYLTENGNIWYPVARSDWPTSPVGASGPMQFMPGTWTSYQQDGNGDGTKDVMNVYDAVFAAAALSKALGTDTTTPLGTTSQPLKKPSLLRAAASYNWGEGNVANAGEGATMSTLPTETQNYVNNVYTLISSDFTKSGHSSYPDPKPAEGGSGGPSSTLSCGGIGSADGVTFPIQSTQTAVKNNKPYSWCYTAATNCHHDYNAADIMMPTGTTVIVAVSGTVVSAKDGIDGSSVGTRVQIKGEDGNLWYYAHMGDSTLKLSIGESVNAGQEIAKVGTKQDAQGTDPHVHVDALPPPYDSRPGCSSEACSGLPFIDVQPALVKAFAQLPQ